MREVSKQRREFFDGETGLPNNCAQRTSVQLFMIGNRGLCGRRFPNQNDMTAALSIYFKANLPSALTHSAPETTGNLLTQQPRPVPLDPLARVRHAHVALLRVNRSPRGRSQGLVARFSLAYTARKTRNLGNNETIFAGI
jgi:hypothetical protein